jgi:polysaccharide biosynthesis transport protein
MVDRPEEPSALPIADQDEPRALDAMTATSGGARKFGHVGAPVAGPNPAGYGPATVGSGYGAGPIGDQIHLTDYLRILYKRRTTAIVAFFVVFLSVGVLTLTATPMFEARALIQIENQDQKVVQFQQVLDESRSNDYYQTQYRILQSRLLARRTIESESLWNHAQLLPQPRSAASYLNPLGWPGLRLVGGLFGDGGASKDGADASETAAQAAAVDRFLANLTVSPVRNSRLVEVRYRSPDAQLTSRIVNAIARQYIEQNLEFKFLATREATDFLSARMKDQRKALESSEQALQKYREQTGAVALEDRQNIVVQRLADLNAAVTRARTERIEKEAVYNQVRDAQNSRAVLDTVPAILSNAFIQQLKTQLAELQRQQAQSAEKLGDRHPEMVKIRTAIESTEARIGAEVQKVVLALKNDHQAAVDNERALTATLNQQRAEAQDLNRLAIQYGVLERDTSTNRQMFDALLQRSKETEVGGELRTSNIRIVDQAETPRRQESPNVRNNMLMALVGGMFLAIALVFLFEYLDSTLKTPEQIKAQLGLAFLGMIPSIDVKSLNGPPLVNGTAPQDFAEAFRSVRTNVLFSSAEGGSRSVVVTSTTPGEGKSLVSANLGMTLAASGQRVLVIDADMRRPKLHEMFRSKLEPGLSNVLVGDSKASEAVRKVPVPNLWIMPAGKHPPNPAELLASKRFREFVSSLNQHFDWIIFDSPPVMAVTDATVISNVVSGVVFVVGSEMTSSGAAKAAIEHLDTAKAKYVGAVLNKVDLKRNAYYYSNYYRRSYSHYYTSKPA